ncbi:MAG: HEAT repeat domain-containing protein [Planctomycetota bacterium]|nr:HEAT repeat domain-containing protein [Planctomycetota bacterium]
MPTSPQTASKTTLRSAFPGLAALALVLGAVLTGVPAAQDAQGTADKTAELVAKIKADGDRTKEEVVSELGGLRTPRALEALLGAYDDFQTVFMKREVVRALRLFDGVAECEQKAMQRLMDEATASPEAELRAAAVESLGSCSVSGKHWLELIVKSPADDAVRERALKAHIGLATEADQAWYRQIWKPKKDEDGDDKQKPKVKKAKKGDKDKDEEEAKPRAGVILNSMRLSAFEALVPKLTIDELVEAVTREGYAKIRKSALHELAERGDKKTLELAWAVVKNDGEQPENRVVAARIVAKIDGTKAAPDFIKRALRVDIPVELRRGLAEILTAFNDPAVNKDLLNELGKGKAHEKLFQMYAVRSLQDERVDKALLKMLSDKEPEVVAGAARILGERRALEAGTALTKLFEKSKDKDVRRAAIEAVARIRVGDKTWVEELIALTKSEDPEVRNLALTQLGQTSDQTHLERLVAALEDTNWSTRLAALEALEKMRTKESVTAIVGRMPKEEGRLLSEFAQALWRLTGQPFQEDAKSWTAWWGNSKDKFQLLSDVDLEKVRSGEEEYRLRQTTRVKSEFFGIKIVSRRVIFIVDVSGSMEEKLTNDYKGKTGWTRMEVARAELKKCLENLDPGAFFNVMVFSSGVERWTDGALVACDDKHRAEALAYVEKLTAGGGTNLYDSLKEAFTDPEVDTIFVMSDGEPSMGEVVEPLLIREHVASWNENRRIVINTVAVGGQFNILEWLAEDSGGTHVKFE